MCIRDRMETARTLSNLIATGRLQRPKRSIRFLWVPEMTGSYAFLATHEEELKNTVAAINLDMVGENQDLCGSTFTAVSYTHLDVYKRQMA